MLAAWMLMACVPLPYDTDYASTLQVVTVAADPPQVDPFSPVVLEAWVADPFDRGAEVMIWPCTPLQVDEERLRCLEGLDALGRGVRLSTFVRTGFVEDDHVSVQVLPPLQSVLALQAAGEEIQREGLPVPVVVLACDPGVCEIFDQVRADPEPATEAYARAARLLADVELLADQGPREQVSLAVKFYTLAGETTERNEVPLLIPLARRAVPDLDLVRWRFLVEDASPGSDTDLDWQVEARFTAGRVVDQTLQNGELSVTWSPMGDPRDGAMVIAVSDGRGGVSATSVDLPAEVGAPPPSVEEPDTTDSVGPVVSP